MPPKRRSKAAAKRKAARKDTTGIPVLYYHQAAPKATEDQIIFIERRIASKHEKVKDHLMSWFDDDEADEAKSLGIRLGSSEWVEHKTRQAHEQSQTRVDLEQLEFLAQNDALDCAEAELLLAKHPYFTHPTPMLQPLAQRVNLDSWTPPANKLPILSAVSELVRRSDSFRKTTAPNHHDTTKPSPAQGSSGTASTTSSTTSLSSSKTSTAVTSLVATPATNGEAPPKNKEQGLIRDIIRKIATTKEREEMHKAAAALLGGPQLTKLELEQQEAEAYQAKLKHWTINEARPLMAAVARRKKERAEEERRERALEAAADAQARAKVNAKRKAAAAAKRAQLAAARLAKKLAMGDDAVTEKKDAKKPAPGTGRYSTRGAAKAAALEEKTRDVVTQAPGIDAQTVSTQAADVVVQCTDTQTPAPVSQTNVTQALGIDAHMHSTQTVDVVAQRTDTQTAAPVSQSNVTQAPEIDAQKDLTQTADVVAQRTDTQTPTPVSPANVAKKTDFISKKTTRAMASKSKAKALEHNHSGSAETSVHPEASEVPNPSTQGPSAQKKSKTSLRNKTVRINTPIQSEANVVAPGLNASAVQVTPGKEAKPVSSFPLSAISSGEAFLELTTVFEREYAAFRTTQIINANNESLELVNLVAGTAFVMSEADEGTHSHSPPLCPTISTRTDSANCIDLAHPSTQTPIEVAANRAGKPSARRNTKVPKETKISKVSKETKVPRLIIKVSAATSRTTRSSAAKPEKLQTAAITVPAATTHAATTTTTTTEQTRSAGAPSKKRAAPAEEEEDDEEDRETKKSRKRAAPAEEDEEDRETKMSRKRAAPSKKRAAPSEENREDKETKKSRKRAAPAEEDDDYEETKKPRKRAKPSAATSSTTTQTPAPQAAADASSTAIRPGSRARPYICTHTGCNMAFTRREHLKRHVETVHQGLKTHKCPTCGRGFGRKDNLEQHRGTQSCLEAAAEQQSV